MELDRFSRFITVLTSNKTNIFEKQKMTTPVLKVLLKPEFTHKQNFYFDVLFEFYIDYKIRLKHSYKLYNNTLPQLTMTTINQFTIFQTKKKRLDRFKAWVEAIDRKLETDEDYEFFRTKRLCHIHFIPIYCYNNRRLSPNAVPTLYLSKETRDAYWLKAIEVRKAWQQLKLQDEIPHDEAILQKDAVETNHDEAVMGVPVENILSNNTQILLQPDVQESLVNLLIADIVEVEDENYGDVQEQSMIELSVPSPVESYVPMPVAEFIIEYVTTTAEGSVQKLSIKQIPRDITISEEVESLPLEPVYNHEISVDSTLLEASAKEIGIKIDNVQNCIRQPKRKRKSEYDGLSWELPLRIPMEHNYSKASIVAPTSHLSSNGVHPKKTIITLKRRVKELRRKLKFYKQKFKHLLQINQGFTNQIKMKKITKISQKGQTSHKKSYKNVITYSNLKNPRNI